MRYHDGIQYTQEWAAWAVGEYLHRGLEGFLMAFAVESGVWKRVIGIASVFRFRNNLAGSDTETMKDGFQLL